METDGDGCAIAGTSAKRGPHGDRGFPHRWDARGMQGHGNSRRFADYGSDHGYHANILGFRLR